MRLHRLALAAVLALPLFAQASDAPLDQGFGLAPQDGFDEIAPAQTGGSFRR